MSALNCILAQRLVRVICPHCKDRSVDIDGFEGLTGSDALQCRRCGFGFIFQLLEDYYPAPSTGFIVCDRDARVLAAGRGVFELTGFKEGDLMGRDVSEVLTLSDAEPIALVREWGVRKLGLANALKAVDTTAVLGATSGSSQRFHALIITAQTIAVTTTLTTVEPQQSVDACLGLMTDKHIRHLPVMEHGRLIGMLSIGDLVKTMIAEQQKMIDQLQSYITG